jgi:hypothetical protein
MKLQTTFDLLRSKGACESGYRTLAKALGGVEAYGSTKPIDIQRIVETNGFRDALWSLRAVMPEQKQIARRVLVEFACRVAERVLPIYEKKYPGDTRPRAAIDAARAFAESKISLQDLREAKAKAWRAADADADAYADAYAIAAYAAYAAAYAAADAAQRREQDAQREIFIELLAYFDIMPLAAAA